MTNHLTSPEPDDGDDLRGHFSRAFRAEPPFESELGFSLDSAVRLGRRRQQRTVAVRGAAVVACATVVGAAAVALRPTGSSSVVVSPATTSGSPSPTSSPSTDSTPTTTPTVTYTPRPSPTLTPTGPTPTHAPHANPTLTPTRPPSEPPTSSGSPSSGLPQFYAQQVGILQGLAGSGQVSEPRVSSAESEGFQGTGIIVLVTTPAGVYQLTSSVTIETFRSAADFTAGCSSTVTGGHFCTIEGSSATDEMTSVQFNDGSGLASFVYRTALNPTSMLVLTFRNDPTLPSGTTAVGPSFGAENISYSAIRATVAASGLVS